MSKKGGGGGGGDLLRSEERRFSWKSCLLSCVVAKWSDACEVEGEERDKQLSAG